jgi:thioredoxin-like negative regulator of GroEL
VGTGDVTDASWDREVLECPGVAIVEVHTPSSGPCEAFAPTIHRVIEGHASVVALRRLDSRTNHRTTERYAVTSVPTLLIFRDGHLTGRLVGARQAERLLRDLLALIR